MDSKTELPLLYDDGSVLVVNKPADIVVVPARNEDPMGSVHRRLQVQLHSTLWVVHRLDRDTSGVLYFARNAEAHRSLSMAFEKHRVQKEYYAFLLSKEPLPMSGVIDVPLHSARKGKMRPAEGDEEGSLASETHWKLVAEKEGPLGVVSMVRASPKTGRQHQIRVHFRYIGAPLLADELYGGAGRRKAEALGVGSPTVNRLPLHAARCCVPNPADETKLIDVSAPLPEPLKSLAAWLGVHDV